MFLALSSSPHTRELYISCQFYGHTAMPCDTVLAILWNYTCSYILAIK